MSLTPDLDQARQFLDTLDPAGVFTFQALPEAKGSTAVARVRHGTFEDHCAELEALNKEGAGIFVMVNAGDGITKPGAKTCRTKANVNDVRALFVDLDGSPFEPLLDTEAPPNMLVESSPGRWHAYWLVSDCELSQFSALQKSLALRFDGDKSVNDLPRVMRVPGFFHQKGEPFMTRLVHVVATGEMK